MGPNTVPPMYAQIVGRNNYKILHNKLLAGGRHDMPRPCTLHAAAQLQPINALRLACVAHRALLPVAVGSMNIHDVRDRRRQTSDNIIA